MNSLPFDQPITSSSVNRICHDHHCGYFDETRTSPVASQFSICPPTKFLPPFSLRGGQGEGIKVNRKYRDPKQRDFARKLRNQPATLANERNGSSCGKSVVPNTGSTSPSARATQNPSCLLYAGCNSEGLLTLDLFKNGGILNRLVACK